MGHNFFRFLLSLFLLLIVSVLFVSFMPLKYNEFYEYDTIKPPFYEKQYSFIDSLMNTMTQEEKIAQMLMMPVYPEQGKISFSKVNQWIKQYKIGGVIFFKGHPSVVKQWNKYFNEKQFLPLLSAIDAEWGVSMRLDSAVVFPKQMTLGAIEEDTLIYTMGQEIARECKILGLNVNFAPVVDINTNPENIIIGYRSFGSDKRTVARKGYLYALGLQSQGVLAVAKHFPGHGDTEKDSHKTLPVLAHDSLRLFNTELYPFEQLIGMGIGGIMVAHLFVPAFEKQQKLASTLSHHIVSDILKDRLRFDGLIFTDALNMKGVSDYWLSEDLIKKAVLAGNDILLMPPDVEKTIAIIKQMITSGEISIQEINRRVRKILIVKAWLKENKYNHSTKEKLITVNAKTIQNNLYAASTTLLKNKGDILPFKNISNLDAAIVTIKKTKDVGDNFSFMLCNYLYLDRQQFLFTDFLQLKYLPEKINKHETIIIGLFASSRYPTKNYGIPKEIFEKIENLSNGHQVVLVIFGSPYLLNSLSNTDKYDAIAIAYENNAITQKILAEQIFGALPFSGKLPVDAGEFTTKSGLFTESLNRLRYEFPEMEGMDSEILKQIDSLAQMGIDEGAYPGCQVLVAKNGAVIYHKNYGYLTYEKKNPVTDTTIYDLASITKPLATTLALMKLYDEKKFKLSDKLSKYLPALDTTNKKDLSFKEVMTHQAGLTPWIPFYLRTIKNEALFDSVYDNYKHDQYQLPVAKAMYMDTNYVKEIYRAIYQTDLKQKKYKYSDLGFYILKKIVENLSGVPMDTYVNKYFYKQIGTNFLGFNLWKKYLQSQFAPTEQDTFFRHQLVQGYVHDYGAAMMGGVCGHAGLFGNAGDLAKLLQMLLNEGTYGGNFFLRDTTVKRFTSCPYCPLNRRGIGFDKPQTDIGKKGPTCNQVSSGSYGHSGFTGTIVWNDPNHRLIYIFLSNRVYPDIENKKLLNLDIRTKIQSVIYQAILN